MIMTIILASLTYLSVGYVVASFWERWRRADFEKCESYYCKNNHMHAVKWMTWVSLFLWPLTIVGIIGSKTVLLLGDILNPTSGADAIDSVSKKLAEVKAAAEEKKKMHTIVEGKGEIDA